MSDTLLDIEPGLAGLPPTVGDHLRGLRGALHLRILGTVRAAMREQGRSLTGAQGQGLALGVRTAVDTFVDAVAEPDRALAPTRAVFHTLGRTEYREGHRVDALRAVLTLGARDIWAFLVEQAAAPAATGGTPTGPDTGRAGTDAGRAGTDAGPAPADLYVIAGALFGYADALAGAAAEGFLDEQRDTAQDWATLRRRLVTLLVQPDPPAEEVLRAAAEAARWPLPATVAVVSVHGTDAEHLARVVGAGTVATVIGDAVRLVLPEPRTPGRLDQARQALAGRRAAVGPAVARHRARLSYRLSRRALTLHQQGALGPDPVLSCDDHLLTLLTDWEPGLAGHLADTVLAPLAGLRPTTRRTLAQTLHGWLRRQGQVVAVAEDLHTHPQTIRYRMRQLRALFGPALDDPDARLVLALALRSRPTSGADHSDAG
ncbi:helix-turn-helix domain-containing protein [Micromonospora sp. WMMD714]|uniref:PucR family transcriptional regulator n=1 Tax=Micromonospora sp. WMMD714 TaxID=3016097 RepID=UPI00249CDFA3|nr:helix-turn-helix domain-containing protein [Micromonospora sp. WMMD714]WFE65778.1 helix-turn-helix domain-containing protein [Micromonospora sp. WMMD714]